MSFEYDEEADLMGEGMPKGNRRAGFIGLMVAKARRPRGLQRGPDSYATPQRSKVTPANFDLTAINAPSKDLQRRFGNRRIPKEKVGRKKKSVVEKSAKGRFTKEERDELKRLAEEGNQEAKDKLEAIQAAERARKGKQLGKEVKKRQPKKEKKTQADEFAEAQRARGAETAQTVVVPTVDRPQVAARAEGDPTLAEEEREKVNTYLRRFDINTISEANWKKMPRKDRAEYIEDAQRYSGRGAPLEKRSYETDEQFKARQERTAKDTERKKNEPIVSFEDYFAPNTIAARAIRTSPAQLKLDKIGQAMTTLAYYKDPRTKASFEKAKKQIDDPFNKIVRGLKSVADIGSSLANLIPLNIAGKAVKFLYDKVASSQLDEAFAKDDAFKAKYEDKKAMMDKYLANEQKLLEAYATAKKELEQYKLAQYEAYVKERQALKGGRKPTDTQFLQLVKTSYLPTPPPQVEGFSLVVNTPTVDAYVDEATKSVMITLRGTVPTDKKDLVADANIPLNRLSRTDRYIQDKMVVDQIVQRYPPDQYEHYLTGHSLGGAIVNQLKRDYPFLKDAQTYNAAFQPYDLLRQQSGQIKRKYVSTDPLYKLGGRLFQNVTVVPPKSKSLPLGTVGALYDAYQGHALANFDGSGRAVGGQRSRYETIAREYRLHPDDIQRLQDADDQFREFGGNQLGLGALQQLAEQLRTQNRERGRGDFDWDEYDRNERKGGKGRKKGKTIAMPIGEFKAEHKRLVKALAPAAKELAKQKAEVKSYGFGKPPMKLVTASGKVHRGAYHMMADGSVHSGKTHTKRSTPLFVKE